MELLYSIFIQPIEIFYSLLYTFSIDITGSYGIGLIFLSIISAVAFSPLARFAYGLQMQETVISSVLHPQLTKIKKEYSGHERNAAINRLYDRYAYHPIYALRSALGIFLQLPFITAAYYMISSFDAVHGQAFYFVQDLGKPDALLWGINLLPIAMTCINILVIYTSKGLQRKDVIQALLIAFAFLLLLYNAPSALLIFWTTNNIIFLCKNLYSLQKNSEKKRIRKKKTFAFWQSLFPEISQVELSLYRKIFFASITTLVFIVFLYLPINFYVSDTEFFKMSLWQFISELLPIAFTTFIFLAYFWLIFSKRNIKKILAYSAFFLVIFSLLNMFVFVRDFGTLDHGILSRQRLLLEPFEFFRDFANSFLLSLALLIPFFYKKIRPYALSSIAILALPLIVMVCIHSFQGKNIQAPMTPVEYRRAFADIQNYSSEKNVVIIFMDMFTGGHIQKMMHDPWFKDFANLMDGFTWYPDTLSTGQVTLLSFPAIYGGEGYGVRAMNKLGLPLTEIYNKAYAVLPRNFRNSGYAGQVVGAPDPFNQELLKKYDGTAEDILYTDIIDFTHIPGAKQFPVSSLDSSKGKYFALAVALFNISPNVLRKKIYDNGKWLNTLQVLNSFGIKFVKKSLTQFYNFFMSDIDNTAKKPTFKIFYSLLPHFPWYLPENEIKFVDDPYPQTDGQLLLVNNIIPEHYYTERHTIKMLGEYIAHLKAKNVYDNTKIILVSDHDEADSQMLASLFPNSFNKDGIKWATPEHELANLGRPHSLLMIKDFNSRGPMRVNNSLMSISDVPILAASHLESFDEFTRHDPHLRNKDSIREHAIGAWHLRYHKKDQFNIKTLWEVKGSMFDINNWQKTIDEEKNTLE